MLRILVIGSLCISLFFFVRGIVLSRSPLDEAGSGMEAAREASEEEAGEARLRDLAVAPALPSPLPDLTEGYLFNQERMLEPEETAEAAEEEPQSTESPIELTNIEYQGSIIFGDTRIALVSYSTPPTPAQGQPTRPARSIRTALPRPGQRQPQTGAGAEEHARLTVGEALGEYRVAEILPEKIIFQRGGETFEKLLYDSTKQRPEPVVRQRQPIQAMPAAASTRSTPGVPFPRVAAPGGRPADRRGVPARRAVPQAQAQVPEPPVVPPGPDLTQEQLQQLFQNLTDPGGLAAPDGGGEQDLPPEDPAALIEELMQGVPPIDSDTQLEDMLKSLLGK